MPADQKDSRRLVPLVEKISSPEATIIVSKLRSEGFEAHVRSGAMSAIQPGVFADVMVRQRDFALAKALLADTPTEQREQAVVSLTDERVRKDLTAKAPVIIPDEVAFCPSCGSGDTRLLTGRIPTILPFYKMQVSKADAWHRCMNCGRQFQDKLDRTDGVLVGMGWALTLGVVTWMALIWLPRIF